jgi:hypothetical protein
LVNLNLPQVRWELADASTCVIAESGSDCQLVAVLWKGDAGSEPLTARLHKVQTRVAIQSLEGSVLAAKGLVAVLTVTDILGNRFIVSAEGVRT